MSKSLLVGMLALSVGACSRGAANEVSDKDAAGGRTASTERSLVSGTRVEASTQTALSSRTNKTGETLQAAVSGDVTNARGDVVIPSGSMVTLTIAALESARDKGRPDGHLSLVVSSVTVNGHAHPVTANVEPVPYRLVGRGITKDEAGRIAAGTAIGAVAGQVIGKNTKSTVIGGAVGAVAGTAVALRYAERDVVVSAGTPIVFLLVEALSITAR